MRRPIQAQVEEAIRSCLEKINRDEKGLPFVVQSSRLFLAFSEALKKSGYQIAVKTDNA
jgi:hypothetical protein